MGGVVNAASLATRGLPNQGIAQGSQFAVFGTDIGPAEPVQVKAFPFPTTEGLGGVSVKVTSGGSTVDAIMVSASANKVVAVLPSTVPVGTGQVSLSYQGTTVNAEILVVTTNFGIFTRGDSGSGPAVLRNLAEDGSATDNSLTAPARPGQRVSLSGTGLGPVTGDETAGPITGDIAGEVEVWVAGKPAKVTSKGRSECCAGADQITFEVPEGVAGCSVPLAIRAAGVVSNFASMSVSAQGACPDAPIDLAALKPGGNFSTGAITLSRNISQVDQIELTIESGFGSFVRYRADELLSFQSPITAPAIGSCVVIYFSEQIPVPSITPELLDAGLAITVAGPKGSRPLNKREGIYSGEFGTSTSIPGVPLPVQSYLDPGTYTLTGPGGEHVGAFSFSLTVGQPINWTNRSTVGTVDRNTISRTTDLPITWTGAAENDVVTITGFSSSETRATATFICLERGSANRFSVPSWVLSALPASGNGFLSVSNSPNPTRFQASGLDFGQAQWLSSSSRTIGYR
jgi:uncharacterized protein (TIGR03437 family)